MSQGKDLRFENSQNEWKCMSWVATKMAWNATSKFSITFRIYFRISEKSRTSTFKATQTLPKKGVGKECDRISGKGEQCEKDISL